MKDFRGMKRQRGRNRKPGGGSGNGGGGSGGGNNPNRAFESNGPEGMKIRGNAQHVYERYQQMARDAFTSGDRVLAENHLQHAEHYFRVLRTLQPGRPVSEIAARDAFASGFDIDFEDESGDQAMDDGQPMDGDNGDNGDQRQGQGQDRDNNNGRDDYRRNRDDRDYRNDGRDQRNDQRNNNDQRNQEPRENRDFGGEPRRDFGGEPREGGETRGEGQGQGGQGQGAQGQGAQGQGAQGQGGRRDRRRDRFEPRRDQDVNTDPLAVVEPRGSDFPSSQPAPRAPAVEEDASHLPAFLRQPTAPAPAAAAGGDDAERPRRAPRRRRPAEGEDGQPFAETAEEDA